MTTESELPNTQSSRYHYEKGRRKTDIKDNRREVTRDRRGSMTNGLPGRRAGWAVLSSARP
jgi:hypothetical protein